MKLEFVDQWRLWYRRWSTWLAAAYASVTGVMFAYPNLLVSLIQQFPGQARGFTAGAVAAICFLVPVFLVNVRQPKLTKIVKEAKADATINTQE